MPYECGLEYEDLIMLSLRREPKPESCPYVKGYECSNCIENEANKALGQGSKDSHEKKITKYGKLVRDRIPEIIIETGGVPIFHIADESEYTVKLKEKLVEEACEFKESGSFEELSDLLEVIYAILAYEGPSMNLIEVVRKKKAQERGTFSKRIILDEVLEKNQ